MAFSKARRLSDFIAADGTIPTAKFASGTITSAHIADTSITHADLHTDMNLTSKTVLVANASTGDSDTTAANTAFVQQEIAALVDSSPSALNTLNELAAALGDDENFSTTVNASIAAKLPLAGGSLTGALDITAGGNQLTLSRSGFDNILFGTGTANSQVGFHITNSTDSVVPFSMHENAPAASLVLESSGNVGIGTTDPNYKLEVNGHTGVRNGSFLLGTESGSNTGGVEMYVPPGDPNTIRLYRNVGAFGGTYSAQYVNIDLYSGSTYDTRISSDGDSFFNGGNVGIGTSSPVNNANRNTLGLQGAWGGQLDIMVGSTVHAQFGTDNFGSGQSCRIQSQDGIVFRTGGNTERWRFNTTGHLTPAQQHTYDIGGTNAEVRNIYAQGISFGANANASGMDSEILDDYEEGTWTPTLGTEAVTGSGSTGSYNNRYVKIGRLVHVTGWYNAFPFSSITSGTYVMLRGLPFRPEHHATGFTFRYTQTSLAGANYGYGHTSLYGAYLLIGGSTGAAVHLHRSGISAPSSATTHFMFDGTYYTDD